MNKNMSKAAQGGFTLIELIVVIVILGILAATALPKFASMGGDARAASLRAAQGALTSTAAMAHGQFLANSTSLSGGNLNMEGTSVAMNTTSGYPSATTNFATAAGLASADYTVTVGSGSPATLTISPRGVTTVASCQIVYTESTAANTAPTVTPTITDCN